MGNPNVKGIIRWGWSFVLGLHALAAIPFFSRKGGIRVFYGGARAGDVGGPLVKVKRLRALFPERFWGYNVVYVLSNAPYLPGFALALLKLRGVPMVHNQNGLFYPGWYTGDWRMQNRRMARTYHQADHVFYQSEFCKRSADQFLGERSGPGEILYNAVDTSVFHPPAKPLEWEEGTCRFLLTGKIDDHLFYRIESSIRGLAHARAKGMAVILEIAGWVAPGAEAHTKALAQELGVGEYVVLTGPYTQEQAPSVYQGAHAYIMTKHNDPCPNTVLEALSTGLPVLYSDSGGVAELVGDGGIGLECQHSWDEPHVPSTAAIGQGIADIVAGHEGFSAAARRRAVEKFDIRHWERRHSEIFSHLIDGKT